MHFFKMDGTGNDFVILDARTAPARLKTEQIRALAQRGNEMTGGCDQVIIIEPGGKEADLFMRIFNADGGEVAACGNATRCAAWLAARESGKDSIRIRTKAETLIASVRGDDVTVNMGAPRTEWHEIPLAEERDTLHLGIGAGPLVDPAGVSMGNPHAVFFVDDLNGADLSVLGPELERDPLFPERANIGIAKVNRPDHISLRVWERGAGETLSCGTGACAALVTAHRRGLTGREATVSLRGGDLKIAWLDSGEILMSGPVRFHKEGLISL